METLRSRTSLGRETGENKGWVVNSMHISRRGNLTPGQLREKTVVGADPCVCPETIINIYTSIPFQNPLGGVLLRGLRTPPHSNRIGGVDKRGPFRPTCIQFVASSEWTTRRPAVRSHARSRLSEGWRPYGQDPCEVGRPRKN